MPTHKGTSQTDITIGSGGAAATIRLSIEAEAGAIHVATDGVGFTLTLGDASGATWSVVSGALVADAAGSVPIRRSTREAWTPAADSRTPADGLVELARAWRTDLRARGRVVASVTADLVLGSTDAAGVGRAITVLAQDAETLSVALDFDDGGDPLASVVVTLSAVATGDRSLTVDPPTVDDDLP